MKPVRIGLLSNSLLTIGLLSIASSVYAGSCRDYERTEEWKHEVLFPDVVYDDKKLEVPLNYQNEEYKTFEKTEEGWWSGADAHHRDIYRNALRRSSYSRHVDFYLVPYPQNAIKTMHYKVNKSSTLTNLVNGVKQGKYEKRYTCTRLFVMKDPDRTIGGYSLFRRCYNNKTRTPTSGITQYSGGRDLDIEDIIDGQKVVLFTDRPLIRRTVYKCTKDNKMTIDTYELIGATAKVMGYVEQRLSYHVIRHRRGTISNPQSQLDPWKGSKISL